MNKFVDVLGIQFINISFFEMGRVIKENIKNNKKTFIVTANPEIVMHSYENERYRNIVQSAHYVVPDGHGILLASKLLKHPIEERIAGYDLMTHLLNEANQEKWKVYLLGGKEEVNKKAVDRIQKQFPHLKLVGHHHGYFSLEDKEVPHEIHQLKPDLVFVALGFPRQEEWIDHHFSTFDKGIFIGVGGSIDVLAGNVKRAPEFWQKIQLEWLYRLIQQPSRWRRMLALPKFLFKIVKVRNKH
ncbi:WecB/TagA/CpsF family glycosyltransferase [Bacillus sp. V3B]|uniref:WecB/TagA/CpsF family glycosyltransferase n=1 Tax=Bacillus sp. V3B TaxID=2804915 RepID=UPI00210DD525|nr:WecB/TagA/CpsF family glycosyltransferase [Bacillus sp. V3B]MCQ6276840.1 WecB/TagA/CpsF family glycosyltransferase [Bacillus sp. V3B]